MTIVRNIVLGVLLTLVLLMTLSGLITALETPEQRALVEQQRREDFQTRVQAATFACGAHVGMLPGTYVTGVAQIQALDACMRVWFAQQGIRYP